MKTAYLGPDDVDEDDLADLILDYPMTDLAVDTETVSLKNRAPIGVGIKFGPHRVYGALYPDVSPVIPAIMTRLADRRLTKIYHNSMFDLRVLAEFAEEEGFPAPDRINIEDTSLIAQLVGNRASLEWNSEHYNAYSNEYQIKALLEEAGTGATMLDVPFHKIATKCMNDVQATYDILGPLQRSMDAGQRDCYTTDLKMVDILLRMERKGFKLNGALLDYHKERLKREVLGYEETCSELGFNPGSPQQVGYILASRGNLLPFTKSRRGLRTDEEALEELEDPLAALILQYRGVRKLLGTYVEPWVGQSRAFTHFRMDLSTARLASYDRNLQNVPPEMREVFVPDSGLFSWFDYGQLELRVLSYVSGDATMQEAYRLGHDLHAMTAEAGGVIRADGKTFNFAKVYGASDKMLARRTSVPKARIPELRRAWDALYPQAAQWIAHQQYGHGETVTNGYGRTMLLPQIEDRPETNVKAFEAHVGKCAVNYPIQSFAADLVKRAMVKLDSEGADIRLQLHDELILDGAYEFGEELSRIHPELHTPFESHTEPIWK